MSKAQPTTPEAEVEVRHYTRVLRQAIRAAGLSVTEVERRLGVGPKSLRRVFGGQVDLKFRHIVEVLGVIGMSQEEFFKLALRERRRRRSRAGEFMAAFRSAGYRGDLVESAEDLEDPLSDDEFDREVAKVVERVMQRLRVEGRLPPIEEQQPGQGEGKADPGGRGGAEGEPE
jgi:transcriptional regulator with XRE-family HTH domain